MSLENKQPAREESAVAKEQERVDLLDQKKDHQYLREGRNLLALSVPIATGIEHLRTAANERKNGKKEGAQKLEAAANRIETELLALLANIDSATVADIMNKFTKLDSETKKEEQEASVSNGTPDPEKERKVLLETYTKVRRDTQKSIGEKIAYYTRMIGEAEKQIKNRSWGEVFDSTLKVAGLFGKTTQGDEEQELKDLLEARARYLKEQTTFLSRFPENAPKGSPMNTPESLLKKLQDYRTSISLPALPLDMVKNYDEGVGMVKRGRDQGKKLDMDWMAINEELRASEGVLDAWETFFSSVDTGMQIATNAVPYGNLVYNFTKSATSVGIGTKSTEEAAKEFAIDFVSSKLAGGAMKGMKGGGKMLLSKIQPMAEKFGKKLATMKPKTLEKAMKILGKGVEEGGEKVAKEAVDAGFEKVAKATLKSVFSSSAEGMGSAAIQSALSKAGDESYQVLFHDKPTDQAVDAFMQFVQSDQMLYGTLMGGAMQGFFKTFQGRMASWRQGLIQKSPESVQKFAAWEQRMSQKLEDFHAKMMERMKKSSPKTNTNPKENPAPPREKSDGDPSAGAEQKSIKKKIAEDPSLAEGRERNLRIGTLEERILAAESSIKILLGRNIKIDKAKGDAIDAAHKVPMTGKDAKGNPKYSEKDLKEKANILQMAGFKPDEAEVLLRMGVCGYHTKTSDAAQNRNGPNVDSPMRKTLQQIDAGLARGEQVLVTRMRSDGQEETGYTVIAKLENDTYRITRKTDEGFTQLLTVEGARLRLADQGSPTQQTRQGGKERPPPFRSTPEQMKIQPHDFIQSGKEVVLERGNGDLDPGWQYSQTLPKAHGEEPVYEFAKVLEKDGKKAVWYRTGTLRELNDWDKAYRNTAGKKAKEPTENKNSGSKQMPPKEAPKSPHPTDSPFNKGQSVRVKNPNGTVENDWFIVNYNERTGEYRIMNKYRHYMDVTLEDLKSWSAESTGKGEPRNNEKKNRGSGQVPPREAPTTPTEARLQAAEKQIRSQLDDKNLDVSERRYLEYSLADVETQLDSSLNRTQKIQKRLAILQGHREVFRDEEFKRKTSLLEQELNQNSDSGRSSEDRKNQNSKPRDDAENSKKADPRKPQEKPKEQGLRPVNPNATMFETLDVSPHAPFDEVKSAWKKFAVHNHPDKFTNDPEKHAIAHQNMTIINSLFTRYKSDYHKRERN